MAGLVLYVVPRAGDVGPQARCTAVCMLKSWPQLLVAVVRMLMWASVSGAPSWRRSAHFAWRRCAGGVDLHRGRHGAGSVRVVRSGALRR